MGKIKHEYNYIELPIVGNEIADTETGETFDVSNAVILKKTKTGKISINHSSFIYVNTEKLRSLLLAGIKDVDLALLFCMSINLLKGKNICLTDDDNPHSTASIAKMINHTEQTIKIKLNRLEALGLLYHGKVKQLKGYGKVYLVNPILLKNEKVLDIFLKEFFKGSIAIENEVAKISYEYNIYFHLDTSRLKRTVASGLRQVDIALLISMSGKLDDDFNICLNDNDKPHTAASLSKLISSSEQAVKEKLNILVGKNLLHYGVLEKKKDFRKVYVVNPHLIKTTQFFISFLAELFDDIK